VDKKHDFGKVMSWVKFTVNNLTDRVTGKLIHSSD